MIEFPLPDAFAKRLQGQLTDSTVLEEALNEEAGTSIRLHPRKSKISGSLPEGNFVLWNNDGLYLSERPKFGQDPLYHAGLYYPMEASSMFLKQVLDQVKLSDDAVILDLCAAPGGKTLIIKDAFPDHLLVSNEIDGKRVHVLKENSIRWGTENHLIINSEAKKLQSADITFDLIVVDAPCSGEGLFRKDKKSRAEWTEERAAGCAVRQESILADVLPLLSDGGYLVYSTCTFNPDENMRRVAQLVEAGLTTETIPLQNDWEIDTLKEGEATGYQFWPHKVRGEGFFVSLLKKSGEPDDVHLDIGKIKEEAFPFIPEMDFSDLIIQKLDTRFVAFTEQELSYSRALQSCGNIIKKGIYLGEIKGKDFLPSHDLSANLRAHSFINNKELSVSEAMDFLRGNALHSSCASGPVLLKFQNLGIGIGKSNGSRINNLLPKHLRVF